MTMRRVLMPAALLAVAMASATQAAAAGVDGVPAFGHVFLIVGENTSFRQVSPRNAPYLTGTVIPHGAWLTNYHGLTDGSLGDYAAMVSGQFVKCERNNDFSFTNGDVPGQIACHQSVDNLFHQLDGRGIHWQEWNESATNSCDLSDHVSTSPEYRQKVLPAGTTGPNDIRFFDGALATGSVARFNMVSPNNCEN